MTSLSGETYDTGFGIRTAVVVSSDAGLRSAARGGLEDVGLRVREASSFAELDALPDPGKLHLLLYDVRDQPPEAPSFARALRRPPFTPHLGILVLTRATEMPRALEALEQGADDVVRVPFHPVVFGARVRAALNRSILYEKYRLGIEALRESRHELASAIESMSYGFAIFAANGSLRLANQRFFAMYPATTSPAREDLSLEALIRSVSSASGEGRPSRRRARESIDALRRGHQARIRTDAGAVYEIRGSTMPNGGLVTAHEEITERARNEERLRHLALHDPLTGLSNRAHFEEVLERLLHGARRGDHRFALLYVDLDEFKNVNDRLGHAAGDQLLVHLAKILRETVREGDLVSRLGGDEFAVLSRNAAAENEVRQIGERLRRRLGTRFPRGPRGVRIGLSIGAVIQPSGGAEVTAQTLVARADAAMYAAKRAGRPEVVFYDASLPSRENQSNLGGRFS